MSGNSQFWFGILHVVSVVYLTAVVAVVLGSQDQDSPAKALPQVLGCWGKLLGSLVGIGLLVYILSLFAG